MLFSSSSTLENKISRFFKRNRNLLMFSRDFIMLGNCGLIGRVSFKVSDTLRVFSLVLFPKVQFIKRLAALAFLCK